MNENKNETQEQGKRLHILSLKEYEEIYGLPKFTNNDRLNYFDLNYFELEKLNQIKSNEAKVLYIIQLGYFKAKFQFYPFRLKEVIEDVNYICTKYLTGIKLVNVNLLSYEKSGKNQRKLIRDLLGFQDYTPNSSFQKYLLDLCQIDLNPKFLYENLHIEFMKRKIIIPGYKTFQLLISNAIQIYEMQLHNNLSSLITKEDVLKIDEFMQLKDNDEYLSKLAFIRTSSKGFTQSYVGEEIEKRTHLEKLFLRSKEIVLKLELSEAIIKKYAKYIDAYQYSHIRKWESNKRNLHILCFIYYRYLKSNDDMIRTFIYWVNRYEQDINSRLREQIFKENMENSKMFPGIAKLLKFIYDEKNWKTLSKEQIWNTISKLLDEEQAQKLEKFFEKNYEKHGNLKWKIYDSIQGKIQSNIRNILRNIRLEFSDNIKRYDLEFMNFVKYYQEELFISKDQKRTPKIDYANFPYRKADKEKKYVENDNKRIEIYLFNRIREYINLGEIFIEDSLEFRHIELDLISKEEFRKNQDKIFSEINFPYIQEPLSKVLAEKIKYLDKMYHKVNTGILEGKNEYFNDKGKDDWSLRYDAQEEEGFENFFENYEAELIDILKFVNENTEFLKSFEHIAPINVKKEDEENKLIAVLLGYGTNLGLWRISKNLIGMYTDSQLRTTAMTRFREETLLKANEMIINKTAKLPIFKHFHVNEMGAIHSSSDGQKFSVSVNTITARYSQKYFGNGKGLSVITLSANFQPLAAKTISPNEYEGHYVLELLLMNESEIQPEKHSTDNHGINEVNFGMLDFFGYKFCPRYKTLNRKTQHLVAESKMPEEYKIKPNNLINIDRILREEENIKRVIASIALKKTTAGTIIKKLSNLPERNPLRMAFAEYNKIISSIYILEYIDDEKTRVQIQIVLNRGEALHRLKRALFYADNGKIKGKSEHEQIVYQNSAMVLCSAVIYYNCRILSKLMSEKKLAKEDFEKIVKSTPFVWNHIDIYGKYDFNKKKSIKEIEKKLK